MAFPLTADHVVRALREEGVRVVEYGSWRTNNRNEAGAWGPVHGVMVHHTVTTGTNSSVSLCYKGRSDLPGPLCHGVIAKDGTCYLVGNGRANHAGGGDGDVLAAVIAERALPQAGDSGIDGNPHFYGFECINMGDNRDPWPPEQVEAIVRASAALCRAHGWGKDGETSVIGHLEWQPGKVDPRGPGITMTDVRARVAERLKHPASWNPEEDDMPISRDDAEKVAAAVWNRDIEHGGQTLKAQTRMGRAQEKTLDNFNLLKALTAQVGALSGAVAALAEGFGLTAQDVQDAAEAGAKAALAEHLLAEPDETDEAAAAAGGGA